MPKLLVTQLLILPAWQLEIATVLVSARDAAMSTSGILTPCPASFNHAPSIQRSCFMIAVLAMPMGPCAPFQVRCHHRPGPPCLRFSLHVHLLSSCDVATSSAIHNHQQLAKHISPAAHPLDEVPALVDDGEGRACLLVLPSDTTSSRQEAVAVQSLLAYALQEPTAATSR
jgi:hypothetical protein